ncbi:hypothetical protein M427DRAFT_50263 [Gonapodya prolifera JEL478]|uniref:Uncharacterized protein n=1 Tax=Gonapodya prolifera (strain JEL478) TaxID=1344416 RepID=A0A138ZWH5_GONPJ|nr:hypothetical protein M427DRAFT_50263 [Gonapodya prolifera JEL478]|eukprot:KXS08847.1 hypothetical protein M427DRAFT_50263 [Gonapodya prolifera JEL478]
MSVFYRKKNFELSAAVVEVQCILLGKQKFEIGYVLVGAKIKGEKQRPPLKDILGLLADKYPGDELQSMQPSTAQYQGDGNQPRKSKDRSRVEMGVQTDGKQHRKPDETSTESRKPETVAEAEIVPVEPTLKSNEESKKGASPKGDVKSTTEFQRGEKDVVQTDGKQHRKPDETSTESRKPETVGEAEIVHAEPTLKSNVESKKGVPQKGDVNKDDELQRGEKDEAKTKQDDLFHQDKQRVGCEDVDDSNHGKGDDE